MRGKRSFKAVLTISTLCLSASIGQGGDGGGIVPIPTGADRVKAWVEVSRGEGRMKAVPRMAIDPDALREHLLRAAGNRVPESRGGSPGSLLRAASRSSEGPAGGGREDDAPPPLREAGSGASRPSDDRRTTGIVEPDAAGAEPCVTCDFRSRIFTEDPGPIR